LTGSVKLAQRRCRLLEKMRAAWLAIPDEAFMILIFDEIAMKGIAGVARYRDEFDETL